MRALFFFVVARGVATELVALVALVVLVVVVVGMVVVLESAGRLTMVA